MALKKSELYSSLWQSCDELHGGMDASQYKDYVLVLLFMKYVSDKYAGQREALLDVPTGGSFADMIALKGDKEIGDKPKALIETLSEDLLETFQRARLLDAYDVYQHIMDYWAETMQDDVYMLVGDGWRAAAQPRLIVEDKNQKTKEKPDFTVGRQKFKADLIPAPLLIARYFAAEQAAIEKLEADAAALAQSLEEMAEEHGGEEGLLAEARNDKEKLTKASVTARLKEINGDKELAEEAKVLREHLALLEKEAALSLDAGTKRDAIIARVAAKYGKLTEEEIKTLVVDDKWLAALAAAVQSELDRVSQALTGRIRQLAERYAAPLPQLTTELDTLAARVDGHLKKMGFKP